MAKPVPHRNAIAVPRQALSRPSAMPCCRQTGAS